MTTKYPLPPVVTQHARGQCTEIDHWVVNTLWSPVAEHYIHVVDERLVGDGDSWWRTHANVTTDNMPVTETGWRKVIKTAASLNLGEVW